METYKEIAGYEGMYQISDTGKVISLERISNHPKSNTITVKRREIKAGITSSGYMNLRLCNNGKVKNYLLHRLIAIAFIDNPDNLPVINHKNGIKTDNRIDNLEWTTTSLNVRHSYRVLGRPAPNPWLGKFGKDHARSKAVKQMSLIGELIAVHESMKAAADAIGRTYFNISRCVSGGRKTAFGFKWENA